MRPRNLLAAALLVSLGCGPQPGEEEAGRGLIVIVVDALRADHVSACGYDRATTPYLDAVAAEGVLFTQAFTPAPEVLPAHAAILTGCDPMLARRIALGEPSLGTLVSDWYVPDELPRLPRQLLANGFTTAAFTDHPAIAPVCGFGAGFQEFSGFLSERTPNASEIGAEAVTTKCLNWLSGVDRAQNWFAYLQFDDLDRLWARPEQTRDTFFEPRPELGAAPPVSQEERVYFALPRGRWTGATRSFGQLEARYDGEVQNLDRTLGHFFAGLKRVGRWTNTTVVVVGAYGVGFGESGLIADSGTFSDCDLRVPVIVRPGASAGAGLPKASRGMRAGELTSLVDLAPTLLDLEGLPVPAGMSGVSHAGTLRGTPPSAAEIVFAAGGLQGGFAAIDARFCFEQSSPGALEQEAVSPLSISWYGDARDHTKDVRRFLHDRGASPFPGHLRDPARDPAAEERLSAAGRDHYAWIEKARALLQAGPEARRDADPATVDELRRRGLLGEENEP